MSRRTPGSCLTSPLAPGRYIARSPASKVSKQMAAEPIRSAHDWFGDDFLVDGGEVQDAFYLFLAVFCIYPRRCVC
jgi:hypothetical protein